MKSDSSIDLSMNSVIIVLLKLLGLSIDSTAFNYSIKSK